MEIIEKEKIVEHQDGYYGPNKRDINGKANAGLTLKNHRVCNQLLVQG